MPSCGVCGKAIAAEEMKKDVFGGLMDQIWAGTPFAGNMKFMPNVMEKLAMKCNACGTWICGACAERTAVSQGAGSIRHTNCGGMFETTK